MTITRRSRSRLDPIRVMPPGAVVVLACWAVQQLASLPPAAFGIAGMGAGLLLWLLRGAVVWRYARWRASTKLSLHLCRRLAPRTLRGVLLLCAIVLLAGGHAVNRAQSALAERLAPDLEGIDLVVIGVIDEMPLPSQFGWRTRLLIESCQAPPAGCPGAVAIRLNWPHPDVRASGVLPARPPFQAGERWRLTVRLKRAFAPQNPALFDAELRSLEDGIAAIGTVRLGARVVLAPERLDAFDGRLHSVIERTRTHLRDAIIDALPRHSAVVRGVLIALVVGDQSAIPGRYWELFNRTGIGHLMSISGLHITMLAGLAALLVRRIWRSHIVLPWPQDGWRGLRWPATGRGGAGGWRWRPLAAWVATPRAGWLAAVLAAFAYSALAGWGLPAQRTCWMLAAAGLALVSGRARDTRDVLCTAAAVVCVFDPWAPMAAGFWLSFVAVAAIVWHGSRVSPRGRPLPASPPEFAFIVPAGTRRTQQAPPAVPAPATTPALEVRTPWPNRIARHLGLAAHTQWAATIIMLPLGALFFSSVSLIGPLANAIAIPLVSGLITPLALTGGVLSLLPLPAGPWLLQFGAWLTDWLLVALGHCDSVSWAALGLPAPSVPATLLAVLACLVLLAPWPWPSRGWAAAGLLPLLLRPAAAPAPGELWLTALDVGQGMAVLVETANGRLLYDTGPSYGTDNDAGARILGPYLRARGIDRLQALVVSHRDTDHSGGALSLMRQVPIDWLASSLPPDHPVVRAAPRHHACRRGEKWQWGAIAFEWLHPDSDAASEPRASSNSRSCVLRIVSPAGVVLLAGDIELAQERRLIAQDAMRLRADVLLAPHHGSATSSSSAFLQAVSPTWAVFQVGYLNRFKHPAPRVLARYQSAGIGILRSDHDGAITLRLRADQPPVIERQRLDADRYWRLRIASPVTAPSSHRPWCKRRRAPAPRPRSTGMQ